jgi:hypothetical protein
MPLPPTEKVVGLNNLIDICDNELSQPDTSVVGLHTAQLNSRQVPTKITWIYS